MKLAEYLRKSGQTHKEFGKKVKVSQPQITRIINKSKKPSVDLIERIKKETNGKVTYEDLVN